ncbi:MAG: LysR family transcriptional regulator [Bifidobacteriaceae bacterium]|jgi:molybdate transport repressor ModE-like protein|nr:LysR family transcriptional regulator [Bifidobacteriaceae bacterium]
MAIDPRRLLILNEVVEAGSITAGARRLGWTQPAVTSHIQALEQSLGVPLLLRHASGVTPTEAGLALLNHAKAVAAHLDAAAAETAELKTLQRGSVRLAAFPSALATLVPAALANLRQVEGIGLEIRLNEAEPAAAVDALAQNEADIAVVFQHEGDLSAPELAPGFVHWPLMREDVLLLLPQTRVRQAAGPLNLADFADENWIFGRSRCHDHLVDLCHRAGFSPRIKHETDDYVVVQALVAQGLAISALPQSALAAHRHPQVAVRPLAELTGHAITAVCRPGADSVPSVRAVLDVLRAACRGRGRQGPAQQPPATRQPALT